MENVVKTLRCKKLYRCVYLGYLSLHLGGENKSVITAWTGSLTSIKNMKYECKSLERLSLNSLTVKKKLFEVETFFHSQFPTQLLCLTPWSPLRVYASLALQFWKSRVEFWHEMEFERWILVSDMMWEWHRKWTW